MFKIASQREGFPRSSVGKESASNAGDPDSVPGLGRSCGQRSLAGYSIWGSKELDTTERLTLSLSVGQITSPLWASEVQSNAITFIYS